MQILEDFGVCTFGKLGHVCLSLVGRPTFVKGLEEALRKYGDPPRRGILSGRPQLTTFVLALNRGRRNDGVPRRRNAAAQKNPHRDPFRLPHPDHLPGGSCPAAWGY